MWPVLTMGKVSDASYVAQSGLKGNAYRTAGGGQFLKEKDVTQS